MKNKTFSLLFVLLSSFLFQAQAQSDSKAIAIANEVMEAMGGQEAYDNTRHIRWNFFGFRSLVWDKFEGKARVEIPSQEMTMLINVHDKTGKVMKAGKEMTHADSVKKYLDRAYGAWINDSYWLVMPFKLQDSGVTLKHVGEGKTLAGEEADILSMTFESVGLTPQNKYLVYVDKERKLITQWDFYRNADDEKAGFQTPWPDYRKFGNIMLSGGQSPRGGSRITDIGVYDELPASVYESLEAVDWGKMDE